GGQVEAPLALERRLVGPAERGERNQRRREPRIEHVGIARIGTDALARGGGALPGLLERAAHERGAVFGIPRGNLVAPPELARDAPVLDVAEPLVVDLGPLR